MTTNYYAINGTEVMGMAPSSSANSKLKWETTYQYDLGFDFSVLNNRINLMADIYYKDTRAVIVKKDPALTRDDVVKYCRARLTGYKCPRTIVFVKALPKTAVGKILRRNLRDMKETD